MSFQEKNTRTYLHHEKVLIIFHIIRNKNCKYDLVSSILLKYLSCVNQNNSKKCMKKYKHQHNKFIFIDYIVDNICFYKKRSGCRSFLDEKYPQPSFKYKRKLLTFRTRKTFFSFLNYFRGSNYRLSPFILLLP